MNDKILSAEYIPIIFHLKNNDEYLNFVDFRAKNPDVVYIDTLGEQLHELNLVRDPKLISHGALQAQTAIEVTENDGVWVYFSWKRIAVRILESVSFNELRLSRNKNLITKEEEQILAKKTIAIAGLNVGNP